MPRRAPSWGGGWDTVSPRRSFGTGVVTGVALWAALNALTSSPSQAEYFYAHRNDPAYREWRQEAERAAARDPEVAAKLAELDRRMAQLEAQPGSTGGGPTVAREPARERGRRVLALGHHSRHRRRRRAVLAVAPPRRPSARWNSCRQPTPGLAGSAESRFRVGMVLPVDPAPFLLAAGLTKIQPPDESGMVSIEAVGLLRYGNVLLHRLYLPGGRAFFQLHLGTDGRPDECRYFSVLDEVTPADPQEWGFWLDPREGRDRLADVSRPRTASSTGGSGRPARPVSRRDRSRRPGSMSTAWSAASCRRCYTERRPAARRRRRRPSTSWSARSRPTGQAWVEVDAGIDINPAALQLPGVPLTP